MLRPMSGSGRNSDRYNALMTANIQNRPSASQVALLCTVGYCAVAAAFIGMSFRNVQSPSQGIVWFGLALLITLPGSIVVAMLSNLLIHLSSYGMEYGFTVCAAINAIAIFVIIKKLLQLLRGRSGTEEIDTPPTPI